MVRKNSHWTNYEKMLSYQKKKFLVSVGINHSKNKNKINNKEKGVK